MRVTLQSVLIFALFFLFSPQIRASEDITAEIYFNRAGMKILSGAANVATGWLELPKNIAIWTQRDSNPLIGVVEGTLWGIYHTVGRTGNGAVDFITFWLPTYPIPNPIFVWDDFSKESDYLGWRMGR
ncbi:MAG: exosortase system-associated protein, TIGR04073 family [Gammaproteobacteria bacterium]|nr:MAG: exosortase system-associated protein, TIGR04073 family [Gammaproteobacteria bacterium]